MGCKLVSTLDDNETKIQENYKLTYNKLEEDISKQEKIKGGKNISKQEEMKDNDNIINKKK